MPSKILLSAIRLHEGHSDALGGNFKAVWELYRRVVESQDWEFLLHVDEITYPYFKDCEPHAKLIVEKRPINSILAMELATRRVVQSEQPHLLHKASGQLPLITSGTPMIFGLYDFVYKHVQTPWHKKLYKNISYRQSMKKAVAITSISEFSRQQAIEYFGVSNGKIKTIHLGKTDFADNGSNEIIPCASPYVLSFGHQKHKNVECVIEALSSPLIRHHKFTLLIIGRCPNEAILQSHANQLGVNVVFLGRVSDDQLGNLYRNAVALAFMSHHEGFGLPVVEAMGCGCPVVCSNAFALPEIAGNGAKVLECNDAVGVARELSELLVNDAYRTIRIQSGKDRAKCFSWDKTTEEVLQLYRNILGN
ncbi:glycosyltransferase family 4 protein [Aporhodopirellula aestuarii]|uniref:Glycosyltransferase family 4 protein n=1 Tax=Aporhodopirellula aestuarii TaxID=2950107 RepID=A0ABT0U4I7_9BACT|nr:glycosyltransferase family 1 protein [Aporhodopirellula aestuarii]MCM2371589.1 glycosyltransferase family 4 protein [Aporhodopirellula aestuarii]